MDRLEMLSQREQLMEDIDCIISGFFDDTWDDYEEAACNQLIETICDAVCKNFPAMINDKPAINMQNLNTADGITTPW